MAQSIRELVPTIMREAATKAAAIHAIQQAWTRLVGKELAKHTRPAALRRGTLYVQTDEPGAMFLLSLEKPRLLEKLTRQAGRPVEEILIRPGEISRGHGICD